MTDWLRGLQHIAGREPLAVVSILATEGSVPRGAGTRMLVTDSAIHGTIGGGQLEYRAAEQARAVLALPAGSWRVQDYPLGPLLGQCCGGRVRLLIEHVDPAALGWVAEAREGCRLVSILTPDGLSRHVDRDGPRHAAPAVAVSARGALPGAGATLVEVVGQYRRPLYLFGAGHVGQAIARHAGSLPVRLAWFDTRDGFGSVGGVSLVPEADIETCLHDAPDDAAVLILTHDHGLDYRLTKAALGRGAVAFVGLIGSATKRARFLARLERDGVPVAARDRLTCPIGIMGVPGKEPDVIAIAVLAQLLMLPIP